MSPALRRFVAALLAGQPLDAALASRPRWRSLRGPRMALYAHARVFVHGVELIDIGLTKDGQQLQ